MPRYLHLIEAAEPVARAGVVTEVVGTRLVASGPAVPVGELCSLHTAVGRREALVVGFDASGVLLQPLTNLDGIRQGDRVEALGHGLRIPVGPSVIGRVLDGLGRPLDGRGPLRGRSFRDCIAAPPSPLSRRPIREVLETGIKAIDACCTLGRGQRMGIFAGAGLGKSVLLGEIAKYAQADINVIALVGERGREVGEFVSEVLGPEGMQRSVVVVATSDRPVVERLSAAYAAHALAEHFRDAGLDVLLMMDSVTRFCQAQRELGLAAGEPPTVRGFPPSAFALLPGLLERAGTAASGSITGLYTVLVDGDEEDDPVADNVRAIIDGHLILSRELAGRGIFPAIDLGRSVSRLLTELADADELQLALGAKESWGEYGRVRELVEIGAYQSGSDARVDRAIQHYPHLLDFVKQAIGERHSRSQALQALGKILAAAPAGVRR